MEKLKILILEDNKLDAGLIKEELTEHKFDFTSKLVQTEKDFITAIHGFKPNIILSDYNLPQFTGFEALEIAKKLVPDIPFIIVTGSLSEEVAVDSIKRGAWDYILKENLLRLAPAIKNALKLKEEKDKNKQAEEALQKSEKQLQTLIDNIPDFVCFKDRDSRWLLANEAGIRIFQLEGIDYMGKKDSELAELNSKLRDSFLTCKESDARVWKEDVVIHGEEMIPDADGSVRVYDVTKVPVFQAGRERKGIIVIGHDITERKQAEEKIYKANRLYTVLSQVNQAIVRERDKQKIFQEICNIAIKYGKFRLAWIGFVDKETKLVKPVAFSGEGSDYLKNIKISITDELTGKGPTGRAILERKSVVFNDLENNPDYKPWREQALEKGYRSSAAFPIWLYNNVIGTLNLYAVEPDFFDKDEIKLLEESALDISFALEKFEEEGKRLQMGKELNMERNKLLNILESMQDGVYIVDQQYMLQYVNSHLQKGFVLFKGQKCFKYFYGRKEACPWCKNYDIFKGKTIHHEVFSKKDGRTYDIIDTPLKNIDGHIFKLSILRDITDRKKSEEELKKHRDHLEKLVKERTTELEKANEELRRFNKLFVGREFRIKELKDNVKELEKELRRKKY